MKLKIQIYRLLLLVSLATISLAITFEIRTRGVINESISLWAGFGIIFWVWMLIFSLYDLLFRYKTSIFKWLVVLLVPFVGIYIYFEKVLANQLSSQMLISALNPRPTISEEEITATMLRRTGAAFIDFVCMSQFTYWTIVAYGTSSGQGNRSLNDWHTLYIIAFWFFYLPFSEAAFGRTLGKWIFGLKVVRGDGSKINPVGALRRRLLDFFDLVVFLFLFIRVRRATTLPRRLGDYWAHSWVVRSQQKSVTA